VLRDLSGDGAHCPLSKLIGECEQIAAR